MLTPPPSPSRRSLDPWITVMHRILLGFITPLCAWWARAWRARSSPCACTRVARTVEMRRRRGSVLPTSCTIARFMTPIPAVRPIALPVAFGRYSVEGNLEPTMEWLKNRMRLDQEVWLLLLLLLLLGVMLALVMMVLVLMLWWR